MQFSDVSRGRRVRKKAEVTSLPLPLGGYSKIKKKKKSLRM